MGRARRQRGLIDLLQGFGPRENRVRLQQRLHSQDALAALPAFRANALLSDVIRYREEVGFDDLVTIRNAGFTGPAFFYTGRLTDGLAAKADAVGADGISAGPGPVMDWLERVHALL